ncbi:13799_t:CDS:2 [Cetraspora pellucida]|uniref:Patatin-like phospholipase domain-containing protein n=1 Tax=Cetraspora pellucida TaxID=1433469 RepID=A0A9N9H2M9_9GLOM|nr:13799_t:CDS:2 [Cetraspora pellucida]
MSIPRRTTAFSNLKGSRKYSSKSKKHSQHLPDELSLEYIDESHLAAFEKALSEDPDKDLTEHIAAMNDFMPIHQKVKKKIKVPNGFEGVSYHIVRFPMMLTIFCIITFELALYILIRQIVNIWEYFVQWRGEKYRLREQLRRSTTYDEWIAAAKDLDSYLDYDSWKDEVPFGYYDFNLLQKVNLDLKNLKQGPTENLPMLKSALQHCVKNNFAGVENVSLYSQTYYGTKQIVEEYYDEVSESLDVLRTTKSLSFEEKRKLFRNTYKNYGRTALCLSGGACFGYYHVGVVKALFDADILPTIITGTSAGALIAALVCVRTDDELVQVLKPELCQRLTACSEKFPQWFKRWWLTGARFDAYEWSRKVQWLTKGSLTFREAYERTGRILNISVIPNDPHSPPKVLNYVTAPDCVIWSAVIASAAVPGILNPVVLMQKLKNGTLAPYNYGHKWKDGSLRTDIPTQSLYMHFNVKNTIVSQVNPHVHLFFYAPRGSVGRPVSHRHGRGWRGGFVVASIEQYLKLDLNKWLKWVRDLELLPKFADQDWSSIWLQRFEGNITIWPKSSIWDFFYILTDPDYNRLDQMIMKGQRVTWPKLHMISNRLKIERAIQRGRSELKHEERKNRYNRFAPNDGLGRIDRDSSSSPDGLGHLSPLNSSSDGFEHSSGQDELDEMKQTKSTDYGETDSDTSGSVGSISEGGNTYDMSSTSTSSSSSDDDGLITPDDGQELI